MLFLWLVLGSRSRFAKLRGPPIAGDAPDANDLLATSKRWRHSKGRPVPPYGAARGGCSVISESALVSQGSTLRTDHVVHHVRGPQLKPQLCAASMLPKNMSL